MTVYKVLISTDFPILGPVLLYLINANQRGLSPIMETPFQTLTRQFVTFIERHYLFVLWGILLVTLLLTVAVRIRFIFTLTADLSGVENYNTYWINRFLAGYPLYEDPLKPPFAINVYTPLYFYVFGWIARIAHIPATDVQTIYFAGRGLALVFNLLFAGALYLMARTLRVKPTFAGLAASLSFLLLHIHCYAIRPDSLYNFLIIATLLTFMYHLRTAHERVQTSWLLLTAGLAVLALFTKQSAFFLPVLIGGFILFQGSPSTRWRSLLVFGAGYTVFFGAALWLMGGPDYAVFFTSVVGGLNNGISLKWLIWYVLPELQLYVPIFITGIVIGILYLQHGHSQYVFLGWSILFIFVTSTGTILKAGSHANYYTEFMGLSLVGTSAFVSAYSTQQRYPAGSRLVLIPGCLLLCVFQLHLLARYHYIGFGRDFTSVYSYEEQIASYLRSQPNFSEDTRIFAYTDEGTFLNSLLFRQAVMPHKGISILYPNSPYELNSFRQYVRQGNVKYVIAPSGQFKPGSNIYASVITSNRYRILKAIGPFSIFVLAPESAAAPPTLSETALINPLTQ